MNDTTKLIIGAIVVLLVILVGAFALSNNSTTPATNATVTPDAPATVTPAPTVAPTVAHTVTPEPTVAPTVAPTATPVPSATPSPSAKGGIKTTEFGYVITYPEFAGSYEIHENPNYNPHPTRAKPLVQFATADGFTNCIYNEEGGYTLNYGGFSSFEEDGNYGEVYTTVPVQRLGNTTGTTDVIITVTRDVCYYDGEEQEWGFGDGCYYFDSPLTFTDGQSAADLDLELCSSETHDDEQYSYFLTLTIQPDASYDIGTNSAFTIHTWGTGTNNYMS